jgi:RNA polymerase sigma-70 factor (ECF subfamily)
MSDRPEVGEQNFARLLLRFQTTIYSYIRSLVISPTDAEDLLQETAAVLWQKFDRFQPGSNFLAWALQVARYKVLEFRHRQKRDVLQFSDRFIDVVAADTVAESEQLGEIQELLIECMDSLPPADRDLIETRYWLDVPVKTLAARLGRPQSTIYDAINRIRSALVECVERAMNRAEREGNAAGSRRQGQVAERNKEHHT